MKLHHLFEAVGQRLYHLTSAKSAHKMLMTGQLFMMPVSDGEDILHGQNMEHGEVQHYAFSLARSMSSDYIDQMLSHNGVLLEFDGTSLSNHYKIGPHVNKAAQDEMGASYDEMEERLVGTTPVLKLRGHISRYIKRVHIVDMGNPAVRNSAPTYQQKTYDSLHAFLRPLCYNLKIELIAYSSPEELRRLGR